MIVKNVDGSEKITFNLYDQTRPRDKLKVCVKFVRVSLIRVLFILKHVVPHNILSISTVSIQQRVVAVRLAGA